MSESWTHPAGYNIFPQVFASFSNKNYEFETVIYGYLDSAENDDFKTLTCRVFRIAT